MSKNIILTQNKMAIVDDDDYYKVSKHIWCAKKSGGDIFYAIRREPMTGKHIYMHKQIILADSSVFVDHINGNALDNRKSNLRICTHRQNLCNQKLSSANTSGYRGVSWNKLCGKWHAYIKVKQKRIHLGVYKDKAEAARVYNDAAREYFGEFARLNNVLKELK